MAYESEHDGYLDEKKNPGRPDSYEETLVQMIVGFTELIDKVDRALPTSEYKKRLIHRLMEEKRATSAHVVEEMGRNG